MPTEPERVAAGLLAALGGVVAGAVLGALPVRAEAPLSAIDWLSESVAAPAKPGTTGNGVTGNGIPGGGVAGGTAGSGGGVAGNGTVIPPARADEPAISKSGALPANVAVSVIGGPSPDAVGLLSSAATGFPHELWGLGRLDEVTAAIRGTQTEGLPALQSLLVTLLIAEAAPPADAGDKAELLIARVDKLLELGALDQAAALLEEAGPDTNPEVFRRAFDVALLTGTEDAACADLAKAPALAPTLTTRVFCLARSGDWNAAALTLRTAQALGHVSGLEDTLLSRFLDPDLDEGEELPAPPSPVTPLIWRIYDAIGEPLPTTMMPLAFAHAELSPRAGWKAQLEAAERLARAGVIPANQLLGLYTQRKPAASGGVWDRAEAFQRFDAALTAGDVGAIEQRLPLAYARMADVEAEVPFAELFAAALARLPLTGDAARIGYDMGLLSPDYRSLAASALSPGDMRARFLAGLAAGAVGGLVPPDSMARAIAPAFTAPAIPAQAQELLAQKRVGEAILMAVALIDTGLKGDLPRVAEGLSLLRRLGLEDVARRTALELMILERRG